MNFESKLINKKKSDVSVIIPSKDFLDSLNNTVQALLSQELLPKEIIIIDSSENDTNENYFKKYFNYPFVKFIKVKSKYPGEARNYGSKFATGKYLGFLDSKTIPNKNWIKDYVELIEEKNYDIIFGVTKYISKNEKEKNILAATHGFNPCETTPGSIIKKSFFNRKNIFIENVRTADDLEWRIKIKNEYNNFYTPYKYYLIYKDISKSLFINIKRYFIYSFHTARVDIQTKTKTLYLCLFLIFTAIFIPKWNWILPGWDQHPLYIPNVTKIYFFTIISFIFFYILIKNLIFRKMVSKLTNFTFQFLFIIFVVYFLFRFKISIANSLENFINFVPHTIQYYILLLILLSLLFRGIILPIIRGVPIAYLFPTNFLSVMVFGLIIDITKSPGYLLGAIYQLFNFRIKKRNNINKIYFFTKYSSLSASVRYRFLIYKKSLQKQGYDVQLKNMFDDKFFKKKIYYNKMNIIMLIFFYFKRFIQLLKINRDTLVIIHLELTPYLFSLGEMILKFKKIKYIVDLDDAIYFRNEKFIKKQNYKTYSINSFKFSLKNADKIFTGNNIISNYVKDFNKNIFEIPTIIDTQKVNSKISNKKNKIFTIVWIGSPSTSIYLYEIFPYLDEIYLKFKNFKLRLIGAGNIQSSKFPIEKFEWNIDTEIRLVSECHVGIMPLADTIWSRSKCGFKLIQYMSCNLPAIASPVGINKDIINENVNGFLCSTKEEWINKIKFCIENKNTLEIMGKRAREIINNKFSLNYWDKLYTTEINKLT